MMNILSRTHSAFILAAALILSGCSDSPVDQFQAACSSGEIDSRQIVGDGDFQFEGKIGNIAGTKLEKGPYKAVFAFSLTCVKTNRPMAFMWLGGDLSKTKDGSTVLVTIEKGKVTDVSETGFFSSLWSLLWWLIKAVIFVAVAFVAYGFYLDWRKKKSA